MTTQQQTQKLSEEIEALLKIENDMKKPAGERIDARTQRLLKTQEIQELIMNSLEDKNG
jgi:ribonuclease PH